MAAVTGPLNGQTREVFAAEAMTVARHRPLTWIVPSRDDALVPGFDDADSETLPIPVELVSTPPQGSRERGTVIHKLLEEILTGELDERDGLEARARLLVGHLGLCETAGRAVALDPAELAACVSRALALPQVAGIRGRLRAEVPVYAYEALHEEERVTTGVADALACDEHGRPDVVVDWKSDVAPTEGALLDYRAQVARYLAATGARLGLIVFVTGGTVVSVTPA